MRCRETGAQASAAERLRWMHDQLAEAYGPQHWWPAETPFEVILGAYLTQNTAWKAVERSLGEFARGRSADGGGVAGAAARRVAACDSAFGVLHAQGAGAEGVCGDAGRGVWRIAEKHGGCADRRRCASGCWLCRAWGRRRRMRFCSMRLGMRFRWRTSICGGLRSGMGWLTLPKGTKSYEALVGTDAGGVCGRSGGGAGAAVQ